MICLALLPVAVLVAGILSIYILDIWDGEYE